MFDLTECTRHFMCNTKKKDHTAHVPCSDYGEFQTNKTDTKLHNIMHVTLVYALVMHLWMPLL